MRAWSFVLAVVVLLLAGCVHPPLPGAKRIADGIFWKLRTLGEGERLSTDSDSVLVRVRMARLGAEPGSLFSTERWYGMQGIRPTVAGLLFGKMRQGDSVSVAIEAARVPWTVLGAAMPPAGTDTGWVALELSLLQQRSRAESRALAEALLSLRTEADEERILTAYLLGDPSWSEFLGVLYKLDTTRGRGEPIQSGDLITIAYTASFLDNGRVFDDTHRQPLTFRLGDPGQVIKGLEVAAHVLPRKGGKGRFIIPSKLAFGPTGSSSGIVPPWTPVLYEVEVVSVGPPAAGPA